jgi:hypothetical protein
MPATTLDIRDLNRWLKSHVPFYCRAARRHDRVVTIGADVAHDLTPYRDAIFAEFGDGINKINAYGLKNYITIVAR